MEFFIKEDTALTIPVHNIKEIPFLHDICIELGKAIEQRPTDLRKL